LLKSYNNIKAKNWPIIETIEDYEKLPDLIKKEYEERIPSYKTIEYFPSKLRPGFSP
jgi:hypothetical protein